MLHDGQGAVRIRWEVHPDHVMREGEQVPDQAGVLMGVSVTVKGYTRDETMSIQRGEKESQLGRSEWMARTALASKA